MTDFSPASPSVGSASWASKLAERVARTQYDFVRVSIADSERRITDLISSSEHRLRNQLTEVEQNLRRELRPRRGLSQEVSPMRSISDGRLGYSDGRSLVRSTSSELASGASSPADEASNAGSSQPRPRRMRRNILPEPRVLGLVGENDLSPTAVYNAAFEKSGGQAAVDQWNEISDSLQRHVTDTVLDDLVLSILPASRSEGSSSARRPLHQHYAPDFRTLHIQASAVLSGFNARVQGVAARSKGRPIFTGLKSEKRAAIKGRCRYMCHDKGDIAWYRLTDVVRATISYPDIPQMYQGLQVAAQEFGSAVREVTDHYVEPLPCGYRSLELIVEHDGHLCELILNTEAMFASKEAVGPLTDEARAELTFAVRKGDSEFLRALLDWIDCSSSLDHVLPNLLNEKTQGGSLLHEAVRQGNHEVVQHLLLHAADANIQDKDGNTPLHIALQCGHEQVTWALLDLGRANPRIMNGDQKPALMLGLSVLRSHPDKESTTKAVKTLAYYAGAEHVREVLGHLRELGYKSPQDTAKELKFESSIEELDAASFAAAGPKRSIRTRVNTGFEWAPSPTADARQGLRFDDKTENLDAASTATGEAKRSIRTRINTGFAFKEQMPAEEQKESKLQFSQDITLLDAASSATDGPRREVRTRINTGFAFKKDTPSDDRPQLQFTGSAEVFEAASESSDGPRRSIRDRVSTGFAFEEPPREPKDRELQFNDSAEQLEAASVASSGTARSVRGRVNTGFAAEGEIAKDESLVKHLEFDDSPVQLEAASSASNNPAKSVRARINTGFVRDIGGAGEERGGLHFDDDVVELDAASAATGSTSKSVRARVNTGFAKDGDMARKVIFEDKDKGLNFNEDVEELDAASYASGAAGRSIRTRVNTGFVKDHDVPEDKHKGLDFDDNVVELEAASAASGGSSRSVRTRVNTGFVKDGAELEENSVGLHFSEDVENLEAASHASGGSGRSVRTRVNTGFVKESDAPKEPRQGLHFDEEVEHFDAASAASGTGRSLRARVNTGYVKEEDVAPKQRGLEFDEDVQELDAASTATGGPGRSVRTRVNTGFVKEGDAPAEGQKAIQFMEDAEELDAASSANGTQKSVRARVNTGFVHQAEQGTEDRTGIQFSEDVEQLDAASESTSAPGRSVRTRVNTGFVKGGDAPTGQRLQFDDDVEEREAASAATGTGRSVRARVNTGYVKQNEQPERQRLQFGEDVEEIDAASEAFSGAAASVTSRRRPKLEMPKEEQKSLKFSEGAEELDAASEATGAGTKSVRARVNTGFVKGHEVPHDSRQGLHFNENIEQLDAASEATGGGTKSVRARVNTGFAKGDEVPHDSRQGLHFDDQVEELDAASGATGAGTKSVRARVNTGFAKGDEVLHDSRQGLQFDDQVEELDAASKATGGGTKSVRARVNTGFVKGHEVPHDSRQGLQFDDQVEELEAASASTAGTTSVRARVNTGFAKGDDIPHDSRQGVHFDEQDEELDAASEATGGGTKSVRARVNTGFVKGHEVPNDTRQGLQFDDQVEELEAASASTAGTKSVRTRVNTGFVKGGEVPQDSRQGLHFDEQVEEFEAASEATDGAARSVRTRVNTGYVKQQDSPGQKGLKFSEEVEEVDAASEGTDGSTRAVRTRVNTGYAKDGGSQEDEVDVEVDADLTKRVGFQSDAEELEAASVVEPGQQRRSVRERVSTGWTGMALFTEERAERKASDDDRLRRYSYRRSTSSTTSARSSGKFSVLFDDQHEVREAASMFLSNQLPMRQIRSRKSTGYSESGGNEPTDSSDEDDDLDDSTSQASSRPSLLQRRLSNRRTSRMNSRKITLELAALAPEEKRKIQHMTIFGQADKLAQDSPEMKIDDHRVEGAEKDDDLLHKSLKTLPLFEDIDDQSLDELIEDMAIFEYEDKEQVVRQGDTGGTHFFVVAQGKFAIIKNDKVVVELETGDAFGESVLLIDGSRTATVRAVGTARVYGMEAEDVRDVLRYTYQMEHKQVMNAIENILDAERCEQFRKLNAFQLHKLYMDASVASYETGQVIMSSTGSDVGDDVKFGAQDSTRSEIWDDHNANVEQVWVLVQGAIVLRDGGRDVARVKRYTMFGMRKLLFDDAPLSAVADGSTKCLVLTKQLLDEVFGVAKVPTVLLGADVDQALGDKTSLNDDMREAMAKSFVVQEIGQGKALDTTDVRFVMCLHGDVEVSTDGFASDTRLLRGSSNDIVGLDRLQQSDLKWDIQVRAADKDLLTYIAVWRGADVDIRATDELKDKLKILKSVFLFKTLSQTQLKSLAESMSTQHAAVDEIIVSQGDMGKTFYIIGAGRVSIEKSGRYIRALSKGDFFGERALLNNEPRSATIIAAEACVIWAITSQTFQEVMPKASLDYLKGRMSLQDTEYTFNDFSMLRVIGTGGFGIVKMVQTKSGTKYALKCVKKRPIVELNQQEALMNERSILAGIDHPFIIRLVQSFRNEAFVYFLTEIVGGGELLDALDKLGLLNKQQTQFYAASILLAFEHIHERRVAYLDLKSENVLIDYQGYIKLIDFGLAVKIHGGHCHTVKGTPHFMAPEMILGKGYDTMADLWALGICIYEFMLGELPFGNSSSVKSEIFRAVLKAPLVFPDSFRQKPFAEEAMSLIKGFLNHKPNQRLGGGIEGYAGITGHPFFTGVDWDGLIARFVDPPFVPQKEQYSANTPTTDKPEPLAQHEAAEEAKELESGWTDPDPGWDDDFC